MASTRPPFRKIFYAGAGQSFARHGSVFVMVYRARPAAELLRRREPWFQECLDAPDASLGILSIIDTMSGLLPDVASREVTTEQLSRMGKKIRFVCHAVEGSGVRGVAVRALLRGVALIARVKFPFVFFPTAEEAVRWVVVQPGVVAGDATAHRRDLMAFVTELRAQQAALNEQPSLSG